jgi:hypothetical protein
VPIRDVTTLGLGELLGSLLSAVVEGQTAATGSSLAFVEQFGLIREENQPERFRTVPIRYTKLDENQQPAEFVLEVPLLAMVSIPTLRVKEARIAFQYDVLTTEREEPAEEEEPTTQPDRLGLPVLRPVSLVGYVARRSVTRETRETTGVDVEVTVESEPLPLGIERILELTELAVSRQVTEEET